MKHNEFESHKEEERIDREAAAWVAKKIGGFSASEQDAFFEWLAEDPRHGEWYETHQKLWKKMDILSLWIPEHSKKPNQDLLKQSKPRFKTYWLGGIAAALILGFFMFVAWEKSTTDFDHATQNFVANTYESHILPDGSIIELNEGAALKIDFTPEFRRVELVSSEAHFSVAKDASRPFIVKVRGVEITAVGTAFNVRFTGESVQVIVTEGRIELASHSTGTHGLLTNDTFVKQELNVGEMSDVAFAQENPVIEVEQVSLGDMNKYLSWKPQMFVFNSTPLSKVIEEFNSRNQTHLVIGDAQLGDFPIVASFRSANVDHFVELLELSMGLRVERNREEESITLYSPIL